MSRTRHPKRRSGATLAVVDGSAPPHADEAGSDQDPATMREQVAVLQEQLGALGAPAEVLAALDDVDDIEEAVRRLAEAGMLPSREQAMAGLLEGWKPLLKRGTDPLSAELSGFEFLGMMRRMGSDEEDLPTVLAGLIEQVGVSGTPEALAMLRVLAVHGPAQIQPSAAETADRLVAEGLTDCRWVAELGAPQTGACFGYTDELGSQEGVALSFAYGRKPHAVIVLIDYGLGGGVKDCYVTDRPDRIRAEYQKVAKRHRLVLRDYPPAEARAVVEQALAAPPCPVEQDQVEDIGDYLGLLRQRVTLLPQEVVPGRGTGRKGTARKASAGTTTLRTVHRVKITLRGAKPPIWRRLEITSEIKLEDVHHSIQAAFGWHGFHLWVFTTPTGEYGVPDPELGFRSAAARTLVDVAPRVGDRISYTYDFGDDWEHTIVVEDVLTAEPGVAYPRCLTGRRACPPEDCGGIWAYQELLEILADPEHPEHTERLEWLGLDSADDFDPARFALDEVNAALSDLAKVLVRA